MKRIIILSLVLLLAIACKKEETPPPPKDAMAKVNDSFITTQDLENALSEIEPQYKKFFDSEFGRDSMLDLLLREKLIDAAAKDSGVENSSEYRKAVTDYQASYEASLARLKEELLTSLWVDRLRKDGKISVSQSEIDAYFKKYPYEITVRHMLLANPDTANLVLRELKASGTKEQRFMELEKRYSIDPETADSKTKILTFMPGEFLPEIENAAANSPAYTVQGFFKTTRGFHIIYKIKETRLTKAAAEPRIRHILEQKKLDEYLDSLAKQYKVEVYTNENK